MVLIFFYGRKISENPVEAESSPKENAYLYVCTCMQKIQCFLYSNLKTR